MSKQPPPAPTASAVGPCPTVIKTVGRPGTGSLPSTFAPPDHPRWCDGTRPTSSIGVGGAMVLGKLLAPGRPTTLDNSRARAYCAYSRCGWGCLDVFSLVYHFSFLSPSLWETGRYRLKYCLKGPLSPKQPTKSSIGGPTYLD